jgi:peroxiredoxin 2/4
MKNKSKIFCPMKKIFFVVMILFLPNLIVQAQEETKLTIPALGSVAPSFTAESTNGMLHFPGDFKNKWKIIFSHPADFTPICSTEILELVALQDEYAAKNASIIVVSVDNVASHNEWKKSLETIKYKDRMPAAINFCLVSDEKLDISMKYGMIHPTSSSTKDIRGIFIIDPKNKVRAIFFNPMNVGRNMDEVTRMLTALQKADEEQVLIPADWHQGEDVLMPWNVFSPTAENAGMNDDPVYYQPAWYLTFKKDSK